MLLCQQQQESTAASQQFILTPTNLVYTHMHITIHRGRVSRTAR